MPNVGRPSRHCDACRRRRTKCDQARPACTPCLRKGLACPGYRDEVDVWFRSETVSSYEVNRWKDGRRKTTVALSSSSSNRLINNDGDENRTSKRSSTKGLDNSNTTYPMENNNATTLTTNYIPFRISGSRRDQQLFHFYCDTTRRALSEYPGTGFWAGTVIRWSIYEPVVLRCVIANTSIHQRVRPLPLEEGKKTTTALASGDGDGDARHIASLQEYYNALRLLRQYITGDASRSSSSSSPVSWEVVLISIAVLYGTAHAIGKPGDAQTHLQAGSDILRSWKKDKNKDNTSLETEDCESILGVFSSLYLQGLLLDDRLLSSPYLADTTTTEDLYGPPIPNQFGNGIEAQNVSEDTLARYFRCVVDSNDSHLSSVERQLSLWQSSFREIESIAYNMSSGISMSARCHTALLSVQQWSISVLIKSGFLLRQQQQQQQQRPGLSTLDSSRAAGIYSLLKSNFVLSTKDTEEGKEGESANTNIDTATQPRKFDFRPAVVPHIYLELAQGRDLELQSKALSALWSQAINSRTSSDNDDILGLTMLLRILNLLIESGNRESHNFDQQPSSPAERAGHDAQKNLENLFQVLGGCKRSL